MSEIYKRFTVKPGQHDFRPIDFPSLFWGDFALKFTLYFAANADYNIGKNQGQWNKVGGFSDHIFRNNKDSTMIAFRWNLDTQLMEVAGYYNEKNAWLQPGKILSFEKMDKIEAWTVKKGNERKTYIKDKNGAYHKTSRQAIKNRKVSKKLGLWFGGQARANKIMNVYLDCDKYRSFEVYQNGV